MSRPAPIEPEESIFEGLRWKPILKGALLDLALTLVAFLPLYLCFAGPDFFAEDLEIADRATERAHESLAFNLLSVAIGLACTTIAAFWALRTVDSRWTAHGGWVAVVSLTLALPMALIPGATDVRQPLWIEIVGSVGMLPAGILGGYLASQATRRAV